ncbi:MAG TPA: helix-turn-helix transcriptional regulator [Solirubrobacteraceae bacterium]|nr:helix-turn-helix transcriptional regulator [Solirubrobacteraceae bacterium]
MNDGAHTQLHALHLAASHASVEAMRAVRKQFAANLRRQRVRAGLSQEALAGICGLHRTEVSLLERCKRSPRLETIVILSRGLELASPAELLDGII